MSPRHPLTRSPRRGLGVRRRRRGLSIPELMISLTITAMLLTAAASAFDASAAAVQMNDRFFRATQAARVSMHRITSEVRVGTVDDVWTANEIHVIAGGDADGNGARDISYRYLPAAQQLVLVDHDDPTGTQYVLARNVSAMKFDVKTGQDYNNADCVARVDVEITVRVGDNEVRLSGAAAPRRNLIY